MAEEKAFKIKFKEGAEYKMDENCLLFSAVRYGMLDGVRELIKSIDLPYAKEWSEGYDFLRLALEYEYREIAKLLLLKGFKVNNNTEFSITPLHYAATYGDVEIVEMLLDRNAQIDANDACGRTPLHHAVEKNKVEVVKLLLDRKACVDATDRFGITPLHVASSENVLEIVEILLNYGAYVNPTIYVTPTQNIREGYTPLHYAVEIGSQEVTKLLLKYNADFNIMARCGTPLHIAAEEGKSEIILDLLNQGASINSECTSTGYKPLHLACAKGRTETARLLLTKGADVNAVAKGNILPLYIATKVGHKATVKLLLEHGADVDAHNEDGKTALCCAVERGYSDITKEILKFRPDLRNKSNKSSLNIALERYGIDYKKIVENLLESGFSVNPKDINNCRLLHSAVRCGYLKIVGDFLRYGADVNMKSKPNKDRTLLHTATIFMQEEVAELLINCGANVNAKDRDKMTPIVHAIQNGNLKITKLLLANGANVEDNTLLNMAIYKGSTEIVEIFLQCNLDINGRDKSGRTAINCAVHSADSEANFQKECSRLLHKTTNAKYYLGYGTIPDISNFNTDIPSLHISAERGNEIITQMLLNKGAMVNAKREDGTTALHIAAESGHTNVVELLLKHGAEINSRGREHKTPLHLAALKNRREVVESLIKFGAEVDLIDTNGKTALHIACQVQNTSIIVVLLQNGSDINIRNNDNFTALDCVLHGTGSFFGQIEITPKFYVTESAKIIVRQIVKLKADNLFVNETDLQVIDSFRYLKRHYITCEAEVKRMKNGKIYNTNISFYDILTKGIDQLTIYARNEDIVKVFESGEYAEMFPLYAQVLKNHFKKGQERQCLLKLSIQSFNSLLGYELPHLFINRIFSYLSYLDLINLINACCDKV